MISTRPYDHGYWGWRLSDLGAESHFQGGEEKVMLQQVFPGQLGPDQIIGLVTAFYQVEPIVLTTKVKGPQKGSVACKVQACISVSS